MVANNQLCVSGFTGSVILGWAPAASDPVPMLTASQTYTFDYQASATMPGTVEAKVAHSSDPFTPDLDATNDMVMSSLTSISHSKFTPMNGADSSVGLSFAFGGQGQAQGTVCFKNVSLTAD
jgi:endoglucanase